MPDYSNHTFRYDHYENRRDDELVSGKNHRRMHRTSRRRVRKRGALTPSLTINGRRGRRWSW